MTNRLDREQTIRRRDFYKGQKYTMEDLRAEISANHLATAHRLAHTLKTLAGLINEEALKNIAYKVEHQLRSKKIPSESDLFYLEEEMNHVLAEIADSGILSEETLNAPPPSEEQAALFNQLESLLNENDAACIELIQEISLIPETRVLISQIENFAFKEALVTLGVLRKVLGV